MKRNVFARQASQADETFSQRQRDDDGDLQSHKRTARHLWNDGRAVQINTTHSAGSPHEGYRDRPTNETTARRAKILVVAEQRVVSDESEPSATKSCCIFVYYSKQKQITIHNLLTLRYATERWWQWQCELQSVMMTEMMITSADSETETETLLTVCVCVWGRSRDRDVNPRNRDVRTLYLAYLHTYKCLEPPPHQTQAHNTHATHTSKQTCQRKEPKPNK